MAALVCCRLLKIEEGRTGFSLGKGANALFYVCPNTLPPPAKNELVGAKGFDGGLAPKRPPFIAVGVD